MLATLEILNEGPARGKSFPLRTVLAHVGRGAHNDIRLSDESVSETHAKLQQRADGWYVVDMGSTNGTYVGGTRVIGERRLDGAPDLRFGGMKMRFAPAGVESAAEVEAKGTRAIAAVDRPRRPTVAPASTSAPAPVEEKTGGVPLWVWILVAIAVVAGAFFALKGHA